LVVRLVHVGIGGWGQDWATNVLPNVTAIDVVAWVDGDPGALEAARRTFGVPANRCFADLAAALAAVEADAVLVTVPLRGHIPVTLAALEAGKHVLVEKPFAPTLDEARRAVELAAARQRVLMVSQNYRFFPAPHAVARLIRDGELGAVGTITADFRKHAVGNGQRTRHHQMDDPLLVDMAIHHFDLMRMILGQEPRTIACQTWNPPGSPFVNDAAGAAVITFDGGAVAAWRGNWVSSGPPTTWGGAWSVEGERGEIRWTSRGEGGGVQEDWVELHPLGKPARRLKLTPIEPYGRAGVLTAFARAITLALTSVEAASSGRRLDVPRGGGA
jgi:predicted dehydrogenase